MDSSNLKRKASSKHVDDDRQPQKKQACRVIGSQAFEETSEARLMLRCNHHSFDDVDLD